MRRIAVLALTVLLTGALAACGDDESTPTSPEDTEGSAEEASADPGDETADVDDAPSTAGSGAAGTVTVNGTTYAMDEALRCDTDSLDIEGMERELEAQFFTRTDDSMIQLDLYISSIGDMPMHDVSWNGPEGVFGSSITQLDGTWSGDGDAIYQDEPISVDGNRATGSVVLVDAMTMEDTIDVDFDVVIPDDTFACR